MSGYDCQNKCDFLIILVLFVTEDIVCNCLRRLSVPRELVSKDSAAGNSETVQLGKKDLLCLGTRSVSFVSRVVSYGRI